MSTFAYPFFLNASTTNANTIAIKIKPTTILITKPTEEKSANGMLIIPNTLNFFFDCDRGAKLVG
ncbi:hypothetical protein FACS1894111_01580 [Clostridia bacterium]|nr:hypothetical protein FACS1894111_01580 [Clostridia bacterium]